jgi:N-methylhydantoinase A
MNDAARLIVGVDVGGTYTDLFVLDPAGGRASIVKVPSTRGEEALGFMHGLSRIGTPAARIGSIVHGTTVATNALLERKLARTGLITTRGFRDVLEMRRRDRPQTWGLRGAYVPVVPRTQRLEVDERVLADGSVRTPVDLEQVRQAARRLLEMGCEAICVFFINTYANAANEQAAAEAVRALWPNAHVTAASEVLNEIREFERCSTASLNAALQPVVGGYLQRLASDLQQQGFGGELLIVQSNGGVMSLDDAARLPARTALSGPAAGVIACARIAAAAGFADVITGDMGGTSFDVSLVAGGKPALAAQTAIDFGMVLRMPMVQIETIGAGGGSIAGVDAGGLLQVGPQSAGSHPGPACYGRGNAHPTVTDANVLLGRIAADRPLGGGSSARLDLELARQAIRQHVAAPLGLDVLAAAEAILTVANARMAGAVRVVSIERGHDPRRFAYMPFGGGGALHVCAMLREVGVTTGLVPRYPGVTSALGCVMADMRHDHVQTLNRPLAELDFDDLRARIDSFAMAAQARLDASGIGAAHEIIEFDMLYSGQTHTVPVPLARGQLNAPALQQAFDAVYAATFGRLLGNIAVRVLNLRYARIGERPRFDLSLLAPTRTHMPEPLGTQQVFHAGRWWTALRHARLDLPVACRIAGPAILEQPDTTLWLEPGFGAEVDGLGNLLITATP